MGNKIPLPGGDGHSSLAVQAKESSVVFENSYYIISIASFLEDLTQVNSLSENYSKISSLLGDENLSNIEIMGFYGKKTECKLNLESYFERSVQDYFPNEIGFNFIYDIQGAKAALVTYIGDSSYDNQILNSKNPYFIFKRIIMLRCKNVVACISDDYLNEEKLQIYNA